MAKSDTILGRSPNRKQFEKRRSFRISVYLTSKGKIRYTDPIDKWIYDARPSVQYRIKVYPKPIAY